MGISPLRLFLSTSNSRLTTYTRFLLWNSSSAFGRQSPAILRSKERPRVCRSYSSASTKSRQTNSPDDATVDGQFDKSESSTDGDDNGRRLPDILQDISKDKRLVQTFTDASEASDAAVVGVRRNQPEIAGNVAFQILERIEDVNSFLKELNERQNSSLREKTIDSEDAKEAEKAPSQPTRQRRVTTQGKNALAPIKQSPSYLPEHLSEEISFVIGRDADRKRIDVNLQQVVDVIQQLDKRIEKNVPDVDNMRVPKGRSPLIMSLKMWLPQESQFSYTSISDLYSAYMRLSKSRLTMFVTLSALGGYFVAPFDFTLLAFTGLVVGTTLCSGAANSINQLMEIPFDSQMARTRDRPLVRGQLTPLHAATFASVSASVGTAVLYFGVNGIVAALGFLNLLLYTGVYTPMKRFSIVNTWAGAVVGAIPPLMGWAAATGSLGAGSLLFAGVLYSWQFPHFNALSWNMRADYSRAGYCMMAVTNPGLCKRVSLRHTLFLHGICLLAPVLDVTTWFFACDSFILNAVFTFYAWRFYRDGDAKSSRNLFRFSLVYLPLILAFLLISKKRSNPEPKKKKNENFHAFSSILGI